MSATLAILGANIIPMTPDGKQANSQALAVQGDRITAIGSNEQIRALTTDQTRVLDLTGKTVLPGFIDTHVHLVQTGLGLRGPSVHACRTVSQVLEVVRETARSQEKNVPIFFFRARLDSWDRALTRKDLDRVAPAHPVAVGDFEMHSCVINSRTFEALGLSAQMEDVAVEAGTGMSAGHLTGQAHIAARSWFYNGLDESVRLEALQLAARAALETGVTTVHAIGGRDSFGDHDVRVLVEQRAHVPIRYVIYCQTRNLEKALEARAEGVADVWADGSYSSRSAALLEPYDDDPSTQGTLDFTQEGLNAFIWRAHCLGLQVGMHAVGDAAIEQVLNAYQYVFERDSSFKERRHRIEHFSLPTDAQIERAARLGVVVAMQPALSAGPQEMVGRRLGAERAKRRHPYRKIVDMGPMVAGGSDSDFSPIDPLGGIHVLVNSPAEIRRLGVMQALSLFTINGAIIAHEEKDKGTIEPGKLADLVVLKDNPLSVKPEKLESIRVEMTIVGGQVVYEEQAK